MIEFVKNINLSSIVVGKEYCLECSEQELLDIEEHLGLNALRKFNVNYRFEKNEMFEDTLNVTLLISADCNLITGIGTNEDVVVNEEVNVVLLDAERTNIDADVFKDFDIELISNNKFNILDLSVQYLSLSLYM